MKLSGIDKGTALHILANISSNPVDVSVDMV